MGSVKIDLYSKDLQYKMYSLSDVKVVELLLRYRYKYDPYLYLQPNNNFNQAGEIEPLNSEAIALFQDLERLIEKANLTEQQKLIISLVQDGYTLDQMANTLKLKSTDSISKSFKNACKKIVVQNSWDWRKTIYTSILELKTKECSKCKENIPLTDEFFTLNKDSKDGFYSQCKRCKR